MKAIPILQADEQITVRRHSSINQYKGFLSVMHKNGYTPIQFDSLDGIVCEKIHSRPIIISYSGDIGYHYADSECAYASDKYILFDKKTIELAPLECWLGGDGEFYERYVAGTSIVGLDDASLGVHNIKKLRVGTSFVKADEHLPAVD